MTKPVHKRVIRAPILISSPTRTPLPSQTFRKAPSGASATPVEYACAVEHFKRPARLSVDDWVALAAAGCLMVAALGCWLAPLVH